MPIDLSHNHKIAENNNGVAADNTNDKISVQSHTCSLISDFFPTLGDKFNLQNLEDYQKRFRELQNSADCYPLTYKTSNGEEIALGHDSPMLTTSIVGLADLCFPDPKYTFRDQLVLDLGAGKESTGYCVARDLGARAYIGVDFCFPAELHAAIQGLSDAERTIPYAIVYTSIQEIISAIPNDSCSFICAGIDDGIPKFSELIESMRAYLPKKLHPRGALPGLPLSPLSY